MAHTLPDNLLARGNGLTAERFAALVRAAALVCDTPPELVVTSRRFPGAVRARSLIVLVLRERLGCPWSQIAALFGRAHHSSLLESSKKIALEIQQKRAWFTSPDACIRADAALRSVEQCLAKPAKSAKNF